MTVPQTLPALVYLTAYDTRRRKLTHSHRLHYMVQAAALEELHLRGLVADDRGNVAVRGRATTGDPVLDGVLRLVRASRKPEPWKHWVRTDGVRSRDAQRDQLAAARAVRVERRRFLGVVPYDRVTLPDARRVKALQRTAGDAVTGITPATQLDRRDLALAAIAAVGELDTVSEARVRRESKARIEELVARSGPAVPALKALVDEQNAASSSYG
jgi:hypothetical protein